MNNIDSPKDITPENNVKSPTPNTEDAEMSLNSEQNTVEPENEKSSIITCGAGDTIRKSPINEGNNYNTGLAEQTGNLDVPIIEELGKSSLDDAKQASNPSSSSSDVQEDELNLKWDDDLDDQDGINSDDQQIKDGQAMDVDKVLEGNEHEVNSALSENLESATNFQKEINTTISKNSEESLQNSGTLDTEEEIDSKVDNNQENLGSLETVNEKQNLEENVIKISEGNDLKVTIDNNDDNEKSNIIFEEIEETTIDKYSSELDSSLSTSDQNMSVDTSIEINKDHRLTKPDAMIEIPTQELIEFDDDGCESQSFNLTDNKMDDSAHQEITNDDNEDEEKMNDNVRIKIVQPITDDLKESEDAPDLLVEETNRDSTDTIKEIISTGDFVMKTDLVNPLENEDNLQPSTSAQAISAMTPDASDEAPDVSDSLGLLAESSRVMDYDDQDDQEQDDEDDGDDEEDFDQDDESNLMTAEHSEDSNAQQSESDLPKEQSEMDTDNVQEHTTVEPIVENDIATKDFEEKEELEGESVFKISQVLTETENEQEKGALDKDEDIELGQGDDIKCSDVEVEMKEAEEPSAQPSPETLAVSTDDQETPKDVKTDDNAVDIETVKLSSDTSDNDTDGENKAKAAKNSVLRDLLLKEPIDTVQDPQTKQSPSKTKKLEIIKPKNFYNIVDLEESSSEDDVQEVQKPTDDTEHNTIELDDVTSVNIPKDIEVICSGENTSEILTKEGDMVISGVPKPKTPHKPTRLNTSEVTIKTASNITEPTLVIPETMMEDKANESTEKSKPKFSLEIFSLDSDDEDSDSKKESLPGSKKLTAVEIEKARESNKCINYSCLSGSSGVYRAARAQELAYYDASRRRRAAICHVCVNEVADRTKNLVEGVKNFTPLLELDMDKLSQELVEISDSDSDEESEVREEPKETIGKIGAKLLEEQLADLINSTWKKYKMDARLTETQDVLNVELEKFEKESDEINELLNEAQKATDKLRKDLYATFEQDRKELPALVIYDTPQLQNWSIEDISKETSLLQPCEEPEVEAGHKRRMSISDDVPAKRPAIPLGYAPLDGDAQSQVQKSSSPTVKTDSPRIDDDSVDVSVVRLSAEAAPAGLPPPGELRRAPPRPGARVYAMQNAFGCWLPAHVVDCQPKGSTPTSCLSTICRVRFENKLKQVKILSARYLAYWDPADVRMTIGTRVIALCKYSVNAVKRESFYSGIIAEMPNPVNNYRYLVFFDDGYAQYARHGDTRAVCESAGGGAWRDVHAPSRAFVRDYLRAFPERPMVRLRAHQRLKTEWNGRWWPAEVLQVDASLAEVQFENGRREWIYRGSTRLAPLYLELQAAERHRARALPRGRATANKNAPTLDMPYVEYTRSDELGAKLTDAQQQEELRRQRSVARKSTAAPALPPTAAAAIGVPDGVTSRVVYYTPKNAVKPYKMVPHTCGPKCKRTDVLSLKELRTYNPLAKPLLSGWERQIVRVRGARAVLYRAPCGRRVRTARELHRYLRAVRSDFPVDLFDFNPHTHCLAEFVLNKCHVSKKDLSHGKENVPVPCVNYYDDALPEFCSYNTERTPTAGVPLNLDPEFLCGCDCTDDCEDKTKCACWKLTLEGARTIGLDGFNVGYEYKRLPEPLPSGIYECNSRCKCRHTCLNRVAQHPLQLKLQVFKTLNRGWGIRALNDVPKGAFLCVYAGNLLTDATANLDGLNEGDEYLAELDYIEVLEQMKEGYEEDIPEGDKELDKKESAKKEEEESDDPESSSSEDESKASKTEMEDDDFKPAYGSIGYGLQEFNKRLRKRNKNKEDKKNEGKEKEDKDDKEKKEEKDLDEECITISDDEEVRQPSRLTAQAGMGANQYVPKYKSVRSHFGKDEACYIMDAKVQGNIGRYLNHSCSPNVFVQNVFVDTHDPRFPWVAFFALSHVKAGTELTWNYNYDVGSVPDKVLYCYCGAPNCRGRLL